MSRAKSSRGIIPGMDLGDGGGPAPGGEKFVESPFKVLVDSREQLPYRFEGLRANADQGHARIHVPVIPIKLDVGDYSCFGLANLITIERKSKEDLYSSIGQRRENFEERLKRMCIEYSHSAVVVECDMAGLSDPPSRSRLHPKALIRTIQAWTIRWRGVHWWFMPDRSTAEVITYRLLESFWWQYREGKVCNQERYREWQEAGFPGLDTSGRGVAEIKEPGLDPGLVDGHRENIEPMGGLI